MEGGTEGRINKNGTLFMGVPGWGKMRISLIRFCFPAASLPLVSKVIIGIGREKTPSVCNDKQTKIRKHSIFRWLSTECSKTKLKVNRSIQSQQP